jgi:hypothetical protein
MSEQFYNDTRRPVFRTRFRSNPAHHVAPDRQLNSTQRLVAEINRDIAHLDAEIVADETRTGVTDIAHFKYSLVARQMRVRRENLASTKSALFSRLSQPILEGQIRE